MHAGEPAGIAGVVIAYDAAGKTVEQRIEIALGRQFEQNAIVWSGLDAVPKLILLR